MARLPIEVHGDLSALLRILYFVCKLYFFDLTLVHNYSNDCSCCIHVTMRCLFVFLFSGDDATLFVKGLSDSVNESKLREFFPDAISIRLPMKDGYHRG